jgi:hypothetical protein
MNRSPDERYPLPGWRDWALVAISGAFVAAGLFMMSRDPKRALVVTLFFGLCEVVALGTVMRKFRNHRLRPLRATVVEGVRIRKSRRRALLMGLALFVVGFVSLVFGPKMPSVVVACYCIMGAVGFVLLAGTLAGKFPAGFLQFERDGLLVGAPSWVLTIPWRSVGAVHTGEMNDNPLLLLTVVRPELVTVSPASARAKALARMDSNLAWFGAHVTVMPSLYELDLPLLVKTIEGYLEGTERAPSAVQKLAGASR